MISYENELFTKVANAIRAKYPKAVVAGEYIDTVKSFPHISIYEADNFVHPKARTLTKIENAVQSMFEVNVYSNATKGKKAECKAILKLIDETMEEEGYERFMASPVPNGVDPTIYRMVARYKKILT